MKKSSNVAYAVVAAAAAIGVVGIGLIIYKKPEEEPHIDLLTVSPPLVNPATVTAASTSQATESDRDNPNQTNENSDKESNDLNKNSESGDFYEAQLDIMDTQINGYKDSVKLLLFGYQNNRTSTLAVLARYRNTSEQFMEAAAKASGQARALLYKARQILGDLAISDKVIASVGMIPTFGPIIAGIYAVIRPFIEAFAAATAAGNQLFSANWKPGGDPIFTGWSGDAFGNGDYFLQSIPVLSFSAPIVVNPFRQYSDFYWPQMAAFVRIAVKYPLGIKIPRVEVRSTGEIYYSFNASGNNDLSDKAVGAGQVYGVSVWNPLDISPTGPRGFDPKNPRAWFAAAQAEALTQGWIRDPN